MDQLSSQEKPEDDLKKEGMVIRSRGKKRRTKDETEPVPAKKNAAGRENQKQRETIVDENEVILFLVF